MKNPLCRRIPKELKDDFGKYIVIFLFMVITTGMVSGFLVAGESMKQTYDQSFDKYNVEDGHFALNSEATDDMKKAIEDEGVTLYDMPYYDLDMSIKKSDGESRTLRIFEVRHEVNRMCTMKGSLPDRDDELAIDRMFAENNDIEIGDELEVGGRDYKVCGYVALSDYSTMFQNNNDTMFDATIFGVAVVTGTEFDRLPENGREWSYVWKYNDGMPDDEKKEKKLADDLLKTVYTQAMMNGITVDTFIPRYQNQAINFTGEDIGSDTEMMKWFEYIVIVILAFIFAVTISNTLTKEASVIGTLRASGYTKRELLIHYISLPVIVTFVASIVGNILGYTYFKDMGAQLYYDSYSLTKYETIWNADAFVLTTVVPLIIMLVVNLLVVNNKLKLSPLRFLRHDLSRSRRKKAVKLPHWKFMTRFKTRVILQNIPGYVVMLIGIYFAQVLMMFGLMLNPLLEHYQDDVLDNMLAAHQYVLDSQVETSVDSAETYCVKTLKTTGDIDDEIMVYGIHEDSRYFPKKLKDGDVLVSDGYADKYRLSDGDEIKLKENYGDDIYKFKLTSSVKYPSTLAIFMTEDDFRQTFGLDEGYFTGYFSDEELTDISDHVVSEITKDDLIKVSRQLKKSIGSMFYIVIAFSLLMFMLLVYLLTKLIVERNTISISMVKILGYDGREIGKLYLSSTTIMVAVVTVIDILLSYVSLKVIYRAMLTEMLSGWLPIYMAPWIFPLMFVLSFACYLVIALMQMKKIKKIPMDEALKNVE
ncbi:MAG: FtsX-like permease family protein [Coprococcus eutactus]|uniref:ABC transporter permease n=1 Tax=Coprococcus eutactus TaxID=33043 RepID=UPI001C01CFAD|nr:ABC transporter permease [Coprococcus eutactus]MBT9732533.1 FtsX-like permease family protein [Coprococcus eutactus]MBT9756369.1 FtsX-like permease family protein [Coprococcus eutactus]